MGTPRITKILIGPTDSALLNTHIRPFTYQKEWLDRNKAGGSPPSHSSVGLDAHRLSQLRDCVYGSLSGTLSVGTRGTVNLGQALIFWCEWVAETPAYSNFAAVRRLMLHIQNQLQFNSSIGSPESSRWDGYGLYCHLRGTIPRRSFLHVRFICLHLASPNPLCFISVLLTVVPTTLSSGENCLNHNPSLLFSTVSLRVAAMGAPNNTSLGLGITFPTLAVMSVCARFYARRQKKMKLWWDDYLVLPGLVSHMSSKTHRS